MTIHADPLLHAFPPQFATFAQGLHPPRADAVPLPDILAPAGLDHLVQTFGATLGSAQRRPVLSRWAQHYMLVLLPPAIATALLTRRTPAMHLQAASVVLSHDGHPLAVCLPHGTPDPPGIIPLLHHHLVPMAQAMAAGGLPQPVFWSNAAHVLAWALGIVHAPAHAVTALADRLCAEPALGPLMQSARQGRRGVCCLRFRLPNLGRCGNCPIGCRDL